MRLPPIAVVLLACACVTHPDRPVLRSTSALVVPTLAEQAQAQEVATRPGRRHRELDPLVGAWTTRNVAVDAEGRESDLVPGRAAIDWTLGGRFLRVDQSLEIPGGPAHASSGFLGWDEAHTEYQWLMVSDLSTGMGVARGLGELAKGGIRFTLDVTDPASGGIARATSLLRIVSPGEIALEQIGVDATGLERVVRRTVYRRVTPSR